MERLNKYGFVSGGYIFDYLDRTALDYLNLEYPKTKTENWFTESADVKFYKQWCDEEYDTFLGSTMEYYKQDKGIAKINVKLFLHNARLIIAEATFVFKRANNDFCRITKRNEI